MAFGVLSYRKRENMYVCDQYDKFFSRMLMADVSAQTSNFCNIVHSYILWSCVSCKDQDFIMKYGSPGIASGRPVCVQTPVTEQKFSWEALCQGHVAFICVFKISLGLYRVFRYEDGCHCFLFLSD